jgi:hypothetical protein
MSSERGEADLEQVAGTAPGVEHGAPAPFAMGADELVDRRVDPDLR